MTLRADGVLKRPWTGGSSERSRDVPGRRALRAAKLARTIAGRGTGGRSFTGFLIKSGGGLESGSSAEKLLRLGRAASAIEWICSDERIPWLIISLIWGLRSIIVL